MAARLTAQPFGSTRAPAMWGRVTALTQRVITTCFGIFCPIYVDEAFLIEPAETSTSAYLSAIILSTFAGFA